jgi:hypothetical protein
MFPFKSDKSDLPISGKDLKKPLRKASGYEKEKGCTFRYSLGANIALL